MTKRTFNVAVVRQDNLLEVNCNNCLNAGETRVNGKKLD